MIPLGILNLVIGWLGPSKAKFAKPLIYGAAIALLVALLNLGKCAYDRHVISQHETKAALQQQKAERKADANLQTHKASDDAAAQQRQQEIDNATHNLPDQAPSDRQRARVCLELLRRGNAPPECRPYAS